MTGSVRAFVAVDLHSALREALAEEIKGIRATLNEFSIRWVPTENIHLTIKFLGDVAQDRLEQVTRVLDSFVVHLDPIHASVEGFGWFPADQSPRVLWVGVEEPGGDLAEFAHGLEQELAGAGFEPEGRRFHPHLTIGRVRDRSRPNDLRTRLQAISLGKVGEMQVSELVLFRSKLSPAGARYLPLGKFPLGGRR